MNSLQYRIRRFIYQEFIPVTKTVVALSVSVSLLYYLLFLLTGINLRNYVELVSTNLWLAPWTLITYPFMNPNLFNLVLEALWLWFVGGSLERSWGSKKYLLFLVTTVGLTGLLMVLTELFLVGGGIAVPIYGLLWPLVTITWAWSVLYPGQEMLLFGMFPIQARWTAWLTAILAVCTYLFLAVNTSSSEWLVGIASLCGIPVAYLFISDHYWGRRNSWHRNSVLTSKNRSESSRNKPNRKRFRVIK